MGLPRFTRPKGWDSDSTSPNLYVANCGPAVGLSFDLIASVFSKYGEVKGVYTADESGTRVIVCFDGEDCAKSAFEALHGNPCSRLGGRSLHIRYSVQSIEQVKDSVQVCLTDSELKVPGVYILHDFITLREEEELLAAVDSRPWHHLAKRRVQHYGYEFCYEEGDARPDCRKIRDKKSEICWSLIVRMTVVVLIGSRTVTALLSSKLESNLTRNVDTNQYLGELPSFVSVILERISQFQKLGCPVDLYLDQLTVNEYPIGVGLSPHVDTHSAFEEPIFSLSLAGPCIMEFRKYSTGLWLSKSTSNFDDDMSDSDSSSNFLRRAIYLPPRSMLLLSGEARYAWHHYIPHHKVDKVKDNLVRRGSRRVSFTMRKVRKGPCQCQYPDYCDSQK